MATIDFVEEARKIAAAAQAAGITLRVLGATAFRIHCPEHVGVHIAMERSLSDIDFAAYGQEEQKIEKFFESGLHFQSERRRAALTPGLYEGRHIYEDPQTGLHVDIFLDRLNMCHVVSFHNRLHVDSPTIPLAELTLEKLQIVTLNEKDIKDMLMLLAAHPVGDLDGETINGRYIADLLGRDWGFYYTTTVNLERIRNGLPRYQALFKPEDVPLIQERITTLFGMIEQAPKSLKWKARAAVGTRMQWYNDVEEVERADHLNDIGR
jgi:hypothetical protein